jgi:5-methylthioadenosine/S-adenosylhomocysteine deaminase
VCATSGEAAIDTLIENAYVITVDAQRRVYPRGFLAFKAGRIHSVGSMSAAPASARQSIDARGMTVLPGIANTHNHLLQVAFRGFNDERWPILGNLAEAVSRMSDLLYRVADRLDEERSYALGRLHVLELLKAGYTATHDEHFLGVHKGSADGVWSAVRDAGMRGFLARCPVNGPNVPGRAQETAEEGLVETERLRAKFNSPLVEVVPGVLNYTWLRDPEDMRRLRAGADRMGAHFDVDMTDNSQGAVLKQRGFADGQVAYYRQYGLLDTPIYAGKAVGIRPDEWHILAEHDCRLSMVPTLRYFDGTGLPLHHVLAAGILPGIGTDAPLVSDCQSPWRTMRDLILTQNLAVIRERTEGRTPPPSEFWATAETALEMATLGGARTLFMDRETGSLEPGKSADCVLVDTRQVWVQPTIDGRRLVASLVWGGETQLVHSVYVAGRALVAERQSTFWDEGEVVAAAEHTMRSVVAEAELDALLPSRQPGRTFRRWRYEA